MLNLIESKARQPKHGPWKNLLWRWPYLPKTHHKLHIKVVKTLVKILMLDENLCQILNGEHLLL